PAEIRTPPRAWTAASTSRSAASAVCLRDRHAHVKERLNRMSAAGIVPHARADDRKSPRPGALDRELSGVAASIVVGNDLPQNLLFACRGIGDVLWIAAQKTFTLDVRDAFRVRVLGTPSGRRGIDEVVTAEVWRVLEVDGPAVRLDQSS